MPIGARSASSRKRSSTSLAPLYGLGSIRAFSRFNALRIGYRAQIITNHRHRDMQELGCVWLARPSRFIVKVDLGPTPAPGLEPFASARRGRSSRFTVEHSIRSPRAAKLPI